MLPSHETNPCVVWTHKGKAVEYCHYTARREASAEPLLLAQGRQAAGGSITVEVDVNRLWGGPVFKATQAGQDVSFMGHCPSPHCRLSLSPKVPAAVRFLLAPHSGQWADGTESGACGSGLLHARE